MNRRDYDPKMEELAVENRCLSARVAVLEERSSQLEKRCDKKDAKIEVVQAFQNKTIGYAAAIAAVVTIASNYLSR